MLSLFLLFLSLNAPPGLELTPPPVPESLPETPLTKPSRETQATFKLPPEETDDESTEPAAAPAAKAKKEPWPKPLPERIRAVRTALARHGSPARPEDIAAGFVRAQKANVAEPLETLVTVGQARRTDDGHYVP